MTRGIADPLMTTRKLRRAEDEVAEAARRAILYQEQPPKPPTEVELLRREVAELHDRLRIVAEVLSGSHDCGWDR